MLSLLLSVLARRKIVPLRRRLEAIDRMARAYGYEVGMGAELMDKLKVYPDNPFVNANWRKKVKKTPESASRGWDEHLHRRYS